MKNWKVNWLVRAKNKAFWLSIIPAVLLLVQVVVSLFGVNIDLGNIGDKLLAIVNAVFAVLTIMGVVTAPTAAGIGASQRAKHYTKPKEDFKD